MEAANPLLVREFHTSIRSIPDFLTQAHTEAGAGALVYARALPHTHHF